MIRIFYNKDAPNVSKRRLIIKTGYVKDVKDLKNMLLKDFFSFVVYVVSENLQNVLEKKKKTSESKLFKINLIGSKNSYEPDPDIQMEAC